MKCFFDNILSEPGRDTFFNRFEPSQHSSSQEEASQLPQLSNLIAINIAERSFL